MSCCCTVSPDGDAALSIPGYDVGICPPSGVMAEALLWMLTGEVVSQAGWLRAEIGNRSVSGVDVGVPLEQTAISPVACPFESLVASG